MSSTLSGTPRARTGDRNFWIMQCWIAWTQHGAGFEVHWRSTVHHERYAMADGPSSCH